MIFQRILLFIACFLSVKSVSHFVDRGKIMTPEITVPYFSGAALHNSSDKWIFNLNEVDSLKKMSLITDPVTRRNSIDNFRFSDKQDSICNYSCETYFLFSRRYWRLEIIAIIHSHLLLLFNPDEFQVEKETDPFLPPLFY